MKNKTLITVLGWEDRFISGNEIILKEYNIHKMIIISFLDYCDIEGVKAKRNAIEVLAFKNEIEIIDISLKYDDSIENWKKLNDFFDKFNEQEVLLNITTIPRETIWTLLFFLKKRINNVDYIYFKPKEYCSDWLTKNHKNPRLLFKHSGIFGLNKPLVLFVITGFDDSRLNSLIEYYEPNKIVIFNQDGDQFNNSIRNNGSRLNELFEFEIVEFDSYNVLGATKILQDKIKQYEDSNIIVSSQGPKLSSLSTYSNYLKNSNIALAYVPARDFNKNYSKGIDELSIKGVFNLNDD